MITTFTILISNLPIGYILSGNPKFATFESRPKYISFQKEKIKVVDFNEIYENQNKEIELVKAKEKIKEKVESKAPIVTRQKQVCRCGIQTGCPGSCGCGCKQNKDKYVQPEDFRQKAIKQDSINIESPVRTYNPVNQTKRTYRFFGKRCRT